MTRLLPTGVSSVLLSLPLAFSPSRSLPPSLPPACSLSQSLSLARSLSLSRAQSFSLSSLHLVRCLVHSFFSPFSPRPFPRSPPSLRLANMATGVAISLTRTWQPLFPHSLIQTWQQVLLSLLHEHGNLSSSTLSHKHGNRWCYPRATREQWRNCSMTNQLSYKTMRSGPGERPPDAQVIFPGGPASWALCVGVSFWCLQSFRKFLGVSRFVTFGRCVQRTEQVGKGREGERER